MNPQASLRPSDSLVSRIGGDLVAKESVRRARKQQLPMRESAAQSMPLMRRIGKPICVGRQGEPGFDCPGLTHGTFCGVNYAGVSRLRSSNPRPTSSTMPIAVIALAVIGTQSPDRT